MASEDTIIRNIFQELTKSEGYVVPSSTRKPKAVSEVPVMTHLSSEPVSPLYLHGSQDLHTAHRSLKRDQLVSNKVSQWKEKRMY